MRALILILLGALTASGETVLTFSPQTNVTSRVALWSVAGCVPRAVSAATIYAVATRHNIPWVSPKSAEELFAKKSAWSRTVKIAGWLSAGGAALTGFDVVKAKPQIVAGLAIGGAVITVLLPLAAKEIPSVDPNVGQSLKLDTDGCGVTFFYAAPSNVAGFNEILP